MDAYEEFIPYCQSSEVLGPAPRAGSAGSDGVEAVRAQLTVGFANFTESYVSIVEMKQGEWVKVSSPCMLRIALPIFSLTSKRSSRLLGHRLARQPTLQAPDNHLAFLTRLLWVVAHRFQPFVRIL